MVVERNDLSSIHLEVFNVAGVEEGSHRGECDRWDSINCVNADHWLLWRPFTSHKKNESTHQKDFHEFW